MAASGNNILVKKKKRPSFCVSLIQFWKTLRTNPDRNPHLYAIKPLLPTILSMSDAKTISSAFSACRLFRNYDTNKSWGIIYAAQFGQPFTLEDSKLQYKAHTLLKHLQVNYSYDEPRKNSFNTLYKRDALEEFLRAQKHKKWAPYFYANLWEVIARNQILDDAYEALYSGDIRVEGLIYNFFLRRSSSYFTPADIDKFSKHLDSKKTKFSHILAKKGVLTCIKSMIGSWAGDPNSYIGERAQLKRAGLKAFFSAIQTINDSLSLAEHLIDLFHALNFIHQTQMSKDPLTESKIKLEVESVKPFNLAEILKLRLIYAYFQRDPIALESVDVFLNELAANPGISKNALGSSLNLLPYG